jgi:hypothetical protein
MTSQPATIRWNRRTARHRPAAAQALACHATLTWMLHDHDGNQLVPWAKRGKTRLHDLISLCETHHLIVHAHGYLITPADNDTFTFTRAPTASPSPTPPTCPTATAT